LGGFEGRRSDLEGGTKGRSTIAKTALRAGRGQAFGPSKKRDQVAKGFLKTLRPRAGEGEGRKERAVDFETIKKKGVSRMRRGRVNRIKNFKEKKK